MMNLETFIKAFVCPNTLIRLWIKHESGYKLLFNEETEQEVGEEWKITAGIGWQAAYAGWLVIGVTDILCGEYPEAVNIVIQKEGADNG